MDWSDIIIPTGFSRLDASFKEFVQVPLENIHTRALELLKDLRSSRATLQCLGRVESVDCICQERSNAKPVTTILDKDAAQRVTEQLRRRVRKYRTMIGEEYRCVVPTDRDTFEKGFDRFVEQCLKNSGKKLDHWFRSLVLAGTVVPQLRQMYIAFQKLLRDECAAYTKGPMPPPLFRMISTPNCSSLHSRSKTLTHNPCLPKPTQNQEVSYCRKSHGVGIPTLRQRPWTSSDLNTVPISQGASVGNRVRFQSAPNFLTPCYEVRPSFCYEKYSSFIPASNHFQPIDTMDEFLSRVDLFSRHKSRGWNTSNIYMNGT